MNITEELFNEKDEAYREFQSALLPTVDKERVIGVRVPIIRKLTKKLSGSEAAKEFMRQLPHAYYDEDILHAMLICGIKDIDDCVRELEIFLPYIDNWAVCDLLAPAVLGKHKDRLLPLIDRWLRSDETYTVRFAVEMLMRHFLDGDFREEYLSTVADIRSDEYYVKMMVAWYFATALAKQYEATFEYFEKPKLEPWTRKAAIRKALESYRIPDDVKRSLRELRATL